MPLVPDSMRHVSKHVLTPLVRGFAGKHVFALLRHVGRKSGRKFTTPLIVRKADDMFFIALTYGPSTNWCRNVLAAGGCAIQIHGRWYRAVEPTIVGRATALKHFNLVQRFFLRISGVEQYLQLDARG